MAKKNHACPVVCFYSKMLFRYGEDIETSCEEFETIMENAEQAKKLRRRQSDARWRANLASCYETLKLIIPLNARASKKQVSKAGYFTMFYNLRLLLGIVSAVF